MSLAERPARGDLTGEVCHWADGYPLNVRLYEKMLSSVFDILDEGKLTQVLVYSFTLNIEYLKLCHYSFYLLWIFYSLLVWFLIPGGGGNSWIPKVNLANFRYYRDNSWHMLRMGVISTGKMINRKILLVICLWSINLEVCYFRTWYVLPNILNSQSTNHVAFYNLLLSLMSHDKFEWFLVVGENYEVYKYLLNLICYIIMYLAKLKGHVYQRFVISVRTGILSLAWYSTYRAVRLKFCENTPKILLVYTFRI